MRPKQTVAEAPEGVLQVLELTKRYGGRSGRPMAKRLVAERETFNRAIVRRLRSHWRATPPVDERGAFALDTKAGTLFIRPCETWIALRFEDPDRAVALARSAGFASSWHLNPYSGKWNIHMSTADVETNLRELDRCLASVALSQGATT